MQSNDPEVICNLVYSSKQAFVTAHEGRKCVELHSLGDKQKVAQDEWKGKTYFIPDAVKIFTKSMKRTWCFETKISDHDKATFRFSELNGESGEFLSNPSSALKNACKACGISFKGSMDARMVCGLFSSLVQEVIRFHCHIFLEEEKIPIGNSPVERVSCILEQHQARAQKRARQQEKNLYEESYDEIDGLLRDEDFSVALGMSRGELELFPTEVHDKICELDCAEGMLSDQEGSMPLDMPYLNIQWNFQNITIQDLLVKFEEDAREFSMIYY